MKLLSLFSGKEYFFLRNFPNSSKKAAEHLIWKSLPYSATIVVSNRIGDGVRRNRPRADDSYQYMRLVGVFFLSGARFLYRVLLYQSLRKDSLPTLRMR